MSVTFLLNGETVHVDGEPPTRTALDWLRERRGLCGTKEGCNEGDCGACTVLVTDQRGPRAMNACILFLPQLHGKALRTVEGLSGPDGAPHPVQEEMVRHHGSQCGFCTPGFVVSMAAAHLEGAKDFDDRLAGNLCRCTGYAPIVQAAEAAAARPVPGWMGEDFLALAGELGDGHPLAFHPRELSDLAAWYEENPQATLIAGATDVGLWVTKQLRDLGPVAFIAGVPELQRIEVTEDEIRIGAAVTMTEVRRLMADYHPDYAEMVRRYGSEQVRNAATIGGNIANASPIGDNPPPLIALGARVHLRSGAATRNMPLEDFFLDYGRQDRRRGELVEAVTIPRQPDRLKVYKLSKRFDQDISAVCGAFSITVGDGVVRRARIAFGGMAGIPKRARAVEQALEGRAWGADAVAGAWDAWEEDFQPISDMRASAEYRLEAARGMLTRYLLEDLGAQSRVLEVRP